ncbi:relaxase/mobilization nuclease domain-containing protein [Chitinophaga sp. CC14]|uniref:relaxase/mobilization nuclease domain-containing protein n=1 Tax=Chitinophaga sp. CC14 TaxID=3029199 RepID=UPI003B7ADFD3
MVAIINSGKHIRKSFFYNDNKLESGAADLLMAENYPMELQWMNRDQRLNVLLKTASKKQISRPSLHISLNFAPGEKLSDELLKQITTEYMQAIGLGDQPYLMYRHHDSSHPHVHIVTHRIDPNGDLVDTYMIGRRKSDPARKELEKKYCLVPAAKHESGLYDLSPVNVFKVIYSKSQTKKSIEDRLNYVLKNYKFSSLSALNAVLKGYNIGASRGTKESRMYRKNGLIYHLIGPAGTPAGKPIRSSLLTVEATLKDLQKYFTAKADFSPQQLSRIKNAVDLALKTKPPPSLTELSTQLNKQNIKIVVLKNKARQIYGISYVDNKSRCALNGGDLGPAYSANAVQQRCKAEIIPQDLVNEALKPSLSQLTAQAPGRRDGLKNDAPAANEQFQFSSPSGTEDHDEKGLFEILVAPEDVYEPLPYELRRRKKKKKKKN